MFETRDLHVTIVPGSSSKSPRHPGLIAKERCAISARQDCSKTSLPPVWIGSVFCKGLGDSATSKRKTLEAIDQPGHHAALVRLVEARQNPAAAMAAP